MSTIPADLEPSVRKSIRVRTSAERAFRVYTEQMDSWWPRTHHIGKAPMQRVVLEGKVGGRCYSTHTDGTDCPWGTVLEWEPPRYFVMAWQITPAWKYEPDLTKCSEVEVRFTAEDGGYTRVDLEHRHFERVGEGWDTMRAAVAERGGWSGLLEMFRIQAEKEKE